MKAAGGRRLALPSSRPLVVAACSGPGAWVSRVGAWGGLVGACGAVGLPAGQRLRNAAARARAPVLAVVHAPHAGRQAGFKPHSLLLAFPALPAPAHALPPSLPLPLPLPQINAICAVPAGRRFYPLNLALDSLTACASASAEPGGWVSNLTGLVTPQPPTWTTSQLGVRWVTLGLPACLRWHAALLPWVPVLPLSQTHKHAQTHAPFLAAFRSVCSFLSSFHPAGCSAQCTARSTSSRCSVRCRGLGRSATHPTQVGGGKAGRRVGGWVGGWVLCLAADACAGWAERRCPLRGGDAKLAATAACNLQPTLLPAASTACMFSPPYSYPPSHCPCAPAPAPLQQLMPHAAPSSRMCWKALPCWQTPMTCRDRETSGQCRPT